MQVKRCCYSGIVLMALASLPGLPGALAQSASPWLDPPEDLGSVQSRRPSAPADSPSQPKGAAPLPLPPVRPPAQSSDRSETGPIGAESGASDDQTRQASPRPVPDEPSGPSVSEQSRSARNALAEDARALAVAYLDTWSAPNEMTLDAMRRFYAATVRFHGRVMSARVLLDEKRRFSQRWPERNYAHRPESMEVACDPDNATCRVHSVFDFKAVNRQRQRRSEGVAALELVVSLKGDRPVIIAERSEVLSRARDRRRFGMGSGFNE